MRRVADPPIRRSTRAERSTFANLSDARWGVFEQAYPNDTTTFGSDETTPFPYDNERRVTGVRSEGSWN